MNGFLCFSRCWLGVTACLTLSNCASEMVGNLGSRKEEITAIHGAYASKSAFFVAYSKGVPGRAQGDQDKAVLLATISRARLEESEWMAPPHAVPAENATGAKPIPVVKVEGLIHEARVAPKEALVVKEVKGDPQSTYYCSIQYLSAKGKPTRQLLWLPLKGSYLTPAARPAMAAATVLDVAASPIYILGGIAYILTLPGH